MITNELQNESSPQHLHSDRESYNQMQNTRQQYFYLY